MQPLVLGIETSCDETAVGIVRGRELLANVISSSVDLHARFGGVVPEVASRAHLEAMQQVIAQALQDAKVKIADIDFDHCVLYIIFRIKTGMSRLVGKFLCPWITIMCNQQ